MSLDGQWWIWNHGANNGSSYPTGKMKESNLVVPWSKECRVRLRMNLRFSSSETLRMKRLEILDEEAVVFSGKSSIEEDEEEKEEEDLCIKSS